MWRPSTILQPMGRPPALTVWQLLHCMKHIMEPAVASLAPPTNLQLLPSTADAPVAGAFVELHSGWRVAVLVALAALRLPGPAQLACSPVQCSAVQCSAVQCSAVQCSAVQCSAVQRSAAQRSAVHLVKHTSRPYVSTYLVQVVQHCTFPASQIPICPISACWLPTCRPVGLSACYLPAICLPAIVSVRLLADNHGKPI